jgi:hypothetical protein
VSLLLRKEGGRCGGQGADHGRCWRRLGAARVASATHDVYGDSIETKGMRDFDRNMYKWWHVYIINEGQEVIIKKLV